MEGNKTKDWRSPQGGMPSREVTALNSATQTTNQQPPSSSIGDHYLLLLYINL